MNFTNEVDEIRQFMSNKLESNLNSLQINKIVAKCDMVSKKKPYLKYDISFTDTPHAFVSVNMFEITYGKNGHLEKKHFGFTPDRKMIKFEQSELPEEDIQVCILVSDQIKGE